MSDKSNRPEALVGWAVTGAMLTGLLAWFVAFFAVVNDYDWTAAGLALLAAALAFGLIANALLRQ